jgi:hypothetical protein
MTKKIIAETATIILNRFVVMRIAIIPASASILGSSRAGVGRLAVVLVGWAPPTVPFYVQIMK